MKKNKILFADFAQEDRFELNSYLIYLFKQIRDYLPSQLEDKKINQ